MSHNYRMKRAGYDCLAFSEFLAEILDIAADIDDLVARCLGKSVKD